MRVGGLIIRKPFPTFPFLYGMHKENFVDELTPWNFKQKGICRIGSDGPIYIHIQRGEKPRKIADRTLYYCVRVEGAGRHNADFTTLLSALDYANCRTESALARESRLSNPEEYPPDQPGLSGKYIICHVLNRGSVDEGPDT
jgi:hypothetical protein